MQFFERNMDVGVFVCACALEYGKHEVRGGNSVGLRFCGRLQGSMRACRSQPVSSGYDGWAEDKAVTG